MYNLQVGFKVKGFLEHMIKFKEMFGRRDWDLQGSASRVEPVGQGHTATALDQGMPIILFLSRPDSTRRKWCLPQTGVLIPPDLGHPVGAKNGAGFRWHPGSPGKRGDFFGGLQ
jgi:hypothetical protein